MNLEHLQFDLGEAHYHLTDLLHEIATGELGTDDSPELAVSLEHITDHLHRAWNRRNLSHEEIFAHNQDEFERHCNTVPIFFANRTLGEFALCSDRPLNTAHIHYELNEAAEALQNLLNEIKSGQLGHKDSPELAVHLDHITGHIHRAWNCRMLTEEELFILTQEDFSRHTNTIPNFFGNRLLGEDTFD